jgi:LPS sulfotransferase NodH
MLQLKTDPATPIARHDFCNEVFDNSVPSTRPLRALYVLLSTPRSGSTWLCSEIYRHTGLLVHEYLQHHQYLPHLAKRFGVARETNSPKGTTIDVNLVDYYEALVKWRSHHGVLGINAHIGHLPALRALLAIFRRKNPKSQIFIDYLIRRDKYRQAASLVIARRNRQWSVTKDLTTRGDEDVPRSMQQWMLALEAARAYRKIMQQHMAMMTQSGPLKPNKVFAYEDLVSGGMEEYVNSLMLSLKLRPADRNDVLQVALQKQSGPLNAAITDRLRRWQTLLEVTSRMTGLAQAIAGSAHRPFRKQTRQRLRLH